MKDIFKRTDGLTRLSFLLFIIAAVIFGAYYFLVVAAMDRQGPVISIEDDLIEISVKDDKDVLMQGVTARDNRDGDVTASVMIEGLSNFTSEMERTVTYAAVDQSNNVSTARRKIVYRDYTPPEFGLSAPMSFPASNTNLLANLSASDCLDGDITSSIKIVSAGGYRTGGSGTFDVTFQASNSAGDVAELTTTVTVYSALDYRTTEIALYKYLLYMNRGTSFDARQNLKSIVINGVDYELEEGLGTYGDPTVNIEDQTIGYDRIAINSSLDTSEPGTYDVLYSLTMTTISGDQIYGEVHMPVIVRDN